MSERIVHYNTERFNEDGEPIFDFKTIDGVENDGEISSEETIHEEYIYPNPQPEDFIVFKSDSNEPVFNADIYNRMQVEEAKKALGEEVFNSRGLVWSLAHHFGPTGYYHREENVTLKPRMYDGDIEEPELAGPESPKPNDEGPELTPDEDRERLLKQQYKDMFNNRFDYYDRQGSMNGHQISTKVEREIGSEAEYVRRHLRAD